MKEANLVKKEAQVRRMRLMRIGKLDSKWDSTKAEERDSEESLIKMGAQLRTDGLITKGA